MRSLNGLRAVITEVAQQAVQKRLNPGERKEKPMEYLTDLVTTVPEGTSPVKVDELRAAEAVRAVELAKAGHLVRLWRPPLGPDEWRSIGLFRARRGDFHPRLVTPSYLDEGNHYAAESASQ